MPATSACPTSKTSPTAAVRPCFLPLTPLHTFSPTPYLQLLQTSPSLPISFSEQYPRRPHRLVHRHHNRQQHVPRALLVRRRPRTAGQGRRGGSRAEEFDRLHGYGAGAAAGECISGCWCCGAGEWGVGLGWRRCERLVDVGGWTRRALLLYFATLNR